MDFKKTLLTLLAIFCVVVSAGAVCAADGDSYDDVWAESQYEDDGGWAGSQYNETAETDADSSQYNETDAGLTDRPLIDPDYAHTEAAGEPTNETGNSTVEGTSDVAENTTTNSTAPHTMPATGNPIIALIGVTAVLGGYTILRRR